MILVLFWGLFCNIVNTNLKEGVGRHVNCLLQILNKNTDYDKKKKKSRDITLPTKVCLVKAMVFQ